LPASSAIPTGGLREREAELAALQELAAATADGRGRLVVIEGPAGIGKSGVRSRAELTAAFARGRRGGCLRRPLVRRRLIALRVQRRRSSAGGS
jgi:AAA ATPase-like protein